jgi:hypothetical protein
VCYSDLSVSKAAEINSGLGQSDYSYLTGYAIVDISCGCVPQWKEGAGKYPKHQRRGHGIG